MQWRGCFIGALVKTDEQEVINFLLTTEIIPLCLRIMESGSELSKTVRLQKHQQISSHIYILFWPILKLYWGKSRIQKDECILQVFKPHKRLFLSLRWPRLYCRRSSWMTRVLHISARPTNAFRMLPWFWWVTYFYYSELLLCLIGICYLCQSDWKLNMLDTVGRMSLIRWLFAVLDCDWLI